MAIAALNAARFLSGPDEGGDPPSATAPKSATLRIGPFTLDGGSTVKGWAPVGGAGGGSARPDPLCTGTDVQPLP